MYSDKNRIQSLTQKCPCIIGRVPLNKPFVQLSVTYYNICMSKLSHIYEEIICYIIYLTQNLLHSKQLINAGLNIYVHNKLLYANIDVYQLYMQIYIVFVVCVCGVFLPVCTLLFSPSFYYFHTALSSLCPVEMI